MTGPSRRAAADPRTDVALQQIRAQKQHVIIVDPVRLLPELIIGSRKRAVQPEIIRAFRQELLRRNPIISHNCEIR